LHNKCSLGHGEHFQLGTQSEIEICGNGSHFRNGGRWI